MFFLSLGLPGVTVASLYHAVASTDPLLSAAEYYYDHQDYRQALRLYQEVLKHQPGSLSAVIKVSELKLMYDTRQSARDVLLQFIATQNSLLSADSRRALRDKVENIASLFVTDDGQTSFLQAMVEIKDKGCSGAIPLLNQAMQQEPGNAKVLREKAHCERQLGAYRPFHETLKLAVESDPFDPQLADSLSEADIYYEEFNKVIERYRLAPELLRSTRGRIALAIALEGTGARTEALTRLQALVSDQKPVVVHPVVWFVLGRLFAHLPEGGSESRLYLERFLASAVRPEPSASQGMLTSAVVKAPAISAGAVISRETLPRDCLIDGWDPYRTEDKILAARKILEELRNK